MSSPSGIEWKKQETREYLSIPVACIFLLAAISLGDMLLRRLSPEAYASITYKLPVFCLYIAVPGFLLFVYIKARSLVPFRMHIVYFAVTALWLQRALDGANDLRFIFSK